MFWLERRALKDGLINVELARTGVDDATVDAETAAQLKAEQRTIGQKLYQLYEEVDTIGLLLLGFGWSLVSFPPLSWRDRKAGWRSRARPRCSAEEGHGGGRTGLKKPCAGLSAYLRVCN